MSENTINRIITLIILALLILSVTLVFQDSLGLELKCPIVAGIKLCNVILVYSLILFIVQITKKYEILFIIISGFAFTLSLTTTLKYFFDGLNCDLFIFNIPFCLIILIVLLILIILKFIQVNKHKNS